MLSSLWDYSVLTLKQIDLLKTWAIFKQTEGFHGRTNKPDDSCYSFWIGASLSVSVLMKKLLKTIVIFINCMEILVIEC